MQDKLALQLWERERLRKERRRRRRRRTTLSFHMYCLLIKLILIYYLRHDD